MKKLLLCVLSSWISIGYAGEIPEPNPHVTRSVARQNNLHASLAVPQPNSAGSFSENQTDIHMTGVSSATKAILRTSDEMVYPPVVDFFGLLRQYIIDDFGNNIIKCDEKEWEIEKPDTLTLCSKKENGVEGSLDLRRFPKNLQMLVRSNSINIKKDGERWRIQATYTAKGKGYGLRSNYETTFSIPFTLVHNIDSLFLINVLNNQRWHLSCYMLPVTFLKDEISSHIQPFFQDNDGPLN